MGVEVAPRRFRLTFPEGHGLHRVEMEVRGLSFGELVELNRAYRAYRGGGNVDMEGQLEAVGTLLDIFGRALQEWNIERGGKPIAPDRAGLEGLDPAYLLDAIGSWARKLGAVDAPLEKRSTPTPQIPPIPMEPMTGVPVS